MFGNDRPNNASAGNRFPLIRISKQYETGMPRTLIAPRGDKRFVRRKKGKFTKSQDDVGRSLASDRRKKAKKVAKKGEGDRGDQKRRKTARKKR